jgi:hypothetical protein
MILFLADLGLSFYLSILFCTYMEINLFLSILLCLVMVPLLFIIGAFIIVLLSSLIPSREIANPQTTLYSLKNYSTVNGTFFLGIGSVDGTQTAFYSTVEEDGAIVFKSVPLKDARIYEDSPTTPYYVDYTSEFSNTLWYILFPKSFVENDSSRVDFHIPSGSVLQGYSIK